MRLVLAVIAETEDLHDQICGTEHRVQVLPRQIEELYFVSLAFIQNGKTKL